MTGAVVDPGSFRDPSGFMFTRQGRIFRQVNACCKVDYDLLLSSGLYDRIVRDRLLVPHTERPRIAAVGPSCYKIIEPERIPFISYPYEWCFGQLQDAALLTLSIQDRALQHGMTLKDASSYNVQFLNKSPIHIDTLSFSAYRPGSPWVAYRQFCQHFLAPLSLMSRIDVRCSQILRTHLDGIPIDLTSRLLPARTRFNLPLQLHIHLHARAQKRFQAVESTASRRSIPLPQLRALLENLRATIAAFRPRPSAAGWATYYSMDSYSSRGLEHKKAVTARYIGDTGAEFVWDLGANTGLFSRIAANIGARVLSIDADHDAVQLNYTEARRRHEGNILPLWIDLMNPTGGAGWRNRERRPFLERGQPDLVMALALIHHLAIAQNVPLGMIAEMLAAMTSRWLIIEFVPKSDPKVHVLLSSREDVFPDYDQDHFERAFRRWFTIHGATPLKDSQRTLYLMQVRR